jgi:hypothetical protein
MATIKWVYSGSLTTIFTTELNSLANGSNKITGTALDNDSGLDLYADFEFYIAAQASARSAGAYIPLYILPLVDASNPTYGGDSLDPPGSMWVGSFLLDAATTARYTSIRGVLLPPFDFHVLVMNETGQAFASSGNTLKYRRYNMSSA